MIFMLQAKYLKSAENLIMITVSNVILKIKKCRWQSQEVEAADERNLDRLECDYINS